MEHPIDIRAGTTEHFEDVCELARHLNTVNLPDNPAAIRSLLKKSERSFNGEIRDPLAREYVFVLWDERHKRVLGTSMVIAQLGRRGAPYIYLQVGKEEKYSATLDKHFIHQVLTTKYSYDGPTEIGGLVMHPDFRRSPERLGSLIAYVRFMFIAMHPTLFRDELLAELLPPFEPDGTSPLWEAYGHRFTKMSYREADQLSKSNKEFISSLFPDQIYATLLSEKVQSVIGEVGPETKGVEKMLRRIGFEYAERVDPFDGGPHFTCPTAEVSLIKAGRMRPVAAVSSSRVASSAAQSGNARALLARSFDGPPYFRAVLLTGEILETAGRQDANDADRRGGAQENYGAERAAGGLATNFGADGRVRGAATENSGAAPGSRGAGATNFGAEAGSRGAAAKNFGADPGSRGVSEDSSGVEIGARGSSEEGEARFRGGSKKNLGPEASAPGPGEKNFGVRPGPGDDSKDEFSLLVSEELLGRLGILDRGSAFWMPLPDR